MITKSKLNLKYDKIIAAILLFSANILYYLSLESCHLGETVKCAELMQNLLEKLVIELIVATLIFDSVALYYMHKRKYTIPVICVLNLMIWYITNKELDFELQTAHGYINMIISISITSTIFSLYIFHVLIRGLIGSRFAFALCFLCLCFFYFGIITAFKSFDCRNWGIGFKSTSLDNSISCSISTPWMCITSSTYGGTSDLSKMLGLSCDANFGFIEQTADIYKQSNLVFFPNTRNFNSTERATRNFYESLMQGLIFVNFTDSNRFLNNFIDGSYLTDKQKIIEYYQNKGYEVGVDLTGHNPKLIQRVMKNDTLIELAKKRKARNEEDIRKGLTKDTLPISKNVMYFFFDSLSRVAFKKAFSKTYQFLEKYYDNFNDEMEVFQFFKYNTVAPNTFRSGFSALLGVNTFNLTNDNQPRENIFDVFRKKGYVNGYSASTCSTIPMWYEEEHIKYLNYTENPPFDHENFSLMCDPNFTNGVKKGEYPIDNGVFLPYIRCLYGKHSFNYVFDYSSQLMEAYKDSNQFQLVYFSDAHESTNEAAKYMDKALLQFLIKHTKQFIKDDWSLVFYSDHGIHFGSNFPDYIQEKTLPQLVFLTPRKFANKYRTDLKHYENLFLTPYDIAKLLFSLAGRMQAVIDIRAEDILNRNSTFDNSCELSKIDKVNCRCF